MHLVGWMDVMWVYWEHQQQPFYGPLSGSTRVSRYQKCVVGLLWKKRKTHSSENCRDWNQLDLWLEMLNWDNTGGQKWHCPTETARCL